VKIIKLRNTDAPSWEETIRRCDDAVAHPEQMLKSKDFFEAVGADIAAMIDQCNLPRG
jgi:hypothetical protein